MTELFIKTEVERKKEILIKRTSEILGRDAKNISLEKIIDELVTRLENEKEKK